MIQAIIFAFKNFVTFDLSQNWNENVENHHFQCSKNDLENTNEMHRGNLKFV